jgi:hypothetical protein
MKERVHNMLVNLPWTRERARKDEGIVKLLTAHRMWNETGRTDMSIPDLIDLVRDYTTADREWRDILKNEENLQGEDYEDKEVLAQEKMVKMGYTPGYEKDVTVVHS